MKVNIRGEFLTKKVWVDGRPLRLASVTRATGMSFAEGFTWGHGGPGELQLALAILLALTDERTAQKNKYALKNEFISKLPWGGDFDFDIDVSQYLSAK